MNASQQGRFGIKQLLVLQLVIAPLFLSAAYAQYNSRAAQLDPIKSLIWLLVVPTAYVFVMTVRRLRTRKSGSPVFAGIYTGVFYAFVFLILSFGPFGIPRLAGAFQEFGRAAKSVPTLLSPTMLACANDHLGVPLMITGFLLVNYSVLGAAVGSITGVGISIFVKSANADGTLRIESSSFEKCENGAFQTNSLGVVDSPSS